MFCLEKYKRKMMNELEYDKKREIFSLVAFQCVKIRVCNSIPGITVELLHDVRQDLSDVHANPSYGLIVMLLIFLLLTYQCLIFFSFPKVILFYVDVYLKSLLS